MSHRGPGRLDLPLDEPADTESEPEETAQTLLRDQEVKEKTQNESPQRCGFSLYDWDILMAALSRYLSLIGRGHTTTAAIRSVIRAHAELDVKVNFIGGEKMNGEPD